MFASISRLASNGLLVYTVIFFALTEASSLPRKLYAALDALREPWKGRRADSFFQYLPEHKVLVLNLTAVLVGILNTAVGTDFPVLLAVGAFMLNFIPAVGSILAALPRDGAGLCGNGPGRWFYGLSGLWRH